VDKTGTLTEGKLSKKRLPPGNTPDEVLQLAAS
jgi:cation transport ATPase